ncbi:MAG: triosephosphate isomerase, partial [Clostridia bacterium]|nr:triosephosphate isomerase [Clostridia bacterium]
LICVGETLEEREAGETLEVLQIDTLSTLAALEPDRKIIIAYEPVWAIGTGLTATPEDAETAISYIRDQVRELWGDIADSVRILYGGSVRADNIAELMRCANIDGALIGGASLNPMSFWQIIVNGSIHD